VGKKHFWGLCKESKESDQLKGGKNLSIHVPEYPCGLCVTEYPSQSLSYPCGLCGVGSDQGVNPKKDVNELECYVFFAPGASQATHLSKQVTEDKPYGTLAPAIKSRSQNLAQMYLQNALA
jgi:hypothetical protein